MWRLRLAALRAAVLHPAVSDFVSTAPVCSFRGAITSFRGVATGRAVLEDAQSAQASLPPAPPPADDAARPQEPLGELAQRAAAHAAASSAPPRDFTSRKHRSSTPLVRDVVKTSSYAMTRRLALLLEDKRWADVVTLFEQWRSGELVDGAGVPVLFKPTAAHFNALLEAKCGMSPQERSADDLVAVLAEMEALGVKPNAATFTPHASLSFAQSPVNAFLAETVAKTALASGVGLSVTACHVISAIALVFRLRSAEELLRAMEQSGKLEVEPNSVVRVRAMLNTTFMCAVKVRNMGVASWTLAALLARGAHPDAHRLGEMAAAAAELHDAPACCEAVAAHAAHPAVGASGARLDEGTLVAALDCAARTKHARLEDLAWRGVEAAAAARGGPPSVASFASVVASRSSRAALDAAFDALAQLGAAHPGADGDAAVLAPLVGEVCGAAEALDGAYYVLEARAQRGLPVSPAQLNAVVAACSQAGDVVRAFETFDAFASLGVTPDVGTYNALLAGCVWHGRAAAAPQLVGAMRAAGVQPDDTTRALEIDAALAVGDAATALARIEEAAAAGRALRRDTVRRLLAHVTRHGTHNGLNRVLAAVNKLGLVNMRGLAAARMASRAAAMTAPPVL